MSTDHITVRLEQLEGRLKSLRRINLLMSIAGPTALAVSVIVLIMYLTPRTSIDVKDIKTSTLGATLITLRDSDGNERIELDAGQGRIKIVDPRTKQEFRLTFREVEFYAKAHGKLASLAADVEGGVLILSRPTPGKTSARLEAGKSGSELWLSRDGDTTNRVVHLNADLKTAELHLAVRPRPGKIKMENPPAISAEATPEGANIKVFGHRGASVDIMNSRKEGFGVRMVGEGPRMCPSCGGKRRRRRRR